MQKRLKLSSLMFPVHLILLYEPVLALLNASSHSPCHCERSAAISYGLEYTNEEYPNSLIQLNITTPVSIISFTKGSSGINSSGLNGIGSILKSIFRLNFIKRN